MDRGRGDVAGRCYDPAEAASGKGELVVAPASAGERSSCTRPLRRQSGSAEPIDRFVFVALLGERAFPFTGSRIDAR